MEKIKGQLPRMKVRMGVIPTQQHKDKKVYTRKQKHKGGVE